MGEVVEGEFAPVPGTAVSTDHYGPKLPEESTVAMNKRSKARLNYALSELANEGATKFLKWLDLVAERDPMQAARLYMELLEFSQPRLKAAQVIANLTPSGDAGAGNKLRDMSIAELEEMARGNSS